MKIVTNHLEDVLEIRSARFGDARGSYEVTYEVAAAALVGISRPFVQDGHSISAPAGTIRGLHLQLAPFSQGKLVRVVSGRILDVVVDVRSGSDRRGEHAAIELDGRSGHQLWIPRGFAHGFCTLEPNTEVVYKVDYAYTPSAERSLAWNDPTLGIDWPVSESEATLTDKDRDGLSYQQIIDEIDGLDRHGSAT
ncbi:MAG: dTDP-4-dehydrorhamnose 3,5-epimerase [Acidimicrobiales bacterium]|nr:dTDP-4-dehydrorhamnose 3,5-epimerase [Acidimicrobiales bacterium]